MSMMVASSVPGSPKPHASEEVLWLIFPPSHIVPINPYQDKGLGWGPCAPDPGGHLTPSYLLSFVMPLEGIKVQPGRWQALGSELQVGSWGGNQWVGCQRL